jgi:dolichol-phosphate mannosyltransferase
MKSAKIEQGVAQTEQRRELISCVLPVYNEVKVLNRLVAALESALNGQTFDYEILFVNDGSKDGSADALDQLAAQNSRIKVLHFSRNFGHQAAVHAGLCHAAGDAVIVMDSDLQDEPSCLPAFVEHWRMGFDVVYAVRTNRKENFIKRLLFRAFYRILNAVSCTTIPNDAGIFSLMDRQVVNSVTSLAETDRYLPGLRQWVGFRQIGLPVERNARHDDQPRVSLYQLFQLAKTALFSFSRVPLSAFYVVGAISIGVCACAVGFTLYHKLVTGLAIPGWASMTIMGSFFGAVNALGIGVLGEYVVRIYDQVRNRPQFIVARFVNFDHRAMDTENQILQSVNELVTNTRQTVQQVTPSGKRPLPIVMDSPLITSGDVPTLQ